MTQAFNSITDATDLSAVHADSNYVGIMVGVDVNSYSAINLIFSYLPIIDVPYLISIDAHFYATPVANDSTYGVQYNTLLSKKLEVNELTNLTIFQDWSVYSSYAPINYNGKVYLDNNGSGHLNPSGNISDLFATTRPAFDGYNAASRNANMFLVVGKLHPTGYVPLYTTHEGNSYKINHLIVQSSYYGANQKTNCLDLLYDSTNNKLFYGMNVASNVYGKYGARSSIIDYDGITPFVVNVEVDNSNTIRVYHNNVNVFEYTWTNHIFWHHDHAGSGKTGASTVMYLFNSGVSTNGGASFCGLTGYIGDIIGFTRVLTEEERDDVYNRMKIE